MEDVLSEYDTDYNTIMSTTDSAYAHANAYVYGSITDLTNYNDEILAIRNMLVIRNSFDTPDDSGNASSIKNRQDYMFGDIVKPGHNFSTGNDYIQTVKKLAIDSPRNPSNLTNPSDPPKEIPFRFIATIPDGDEKKLYVSLLTDSNYNSTDNKEMGVITFTYPYEEKLETTTERSSSSHMLDFIAYRNGSFFACFDEFFGKSGTPDFNFSNSVHLYWVNGNTNP